MHGEGDYSGRPFRLTLWQRAVLDRVYELTETGRRRWRRVVLLIASGNGKTEFGAAIAAAELAGPVMFAGWNHDGTPRGKMRPSPNVPVAATNFDQSNILFEKVRDQIRGGRLAEHFTFFDTEIVFADGRPGRLYRIAAVQGGNEGGGATAFFADETHEWTGPRKRVHTVVAKGQRKRRDPLVFEMSTAGLPDAGSLAEDAHKLFDGIRKGTMRQGSTLVINFEASENWNLHDRKQLIAALREANPGADDYLDIEAIADDWEDPVLPEHEFRRYHLNQWRKAPVESWLAKKPNAWGRLADPSIEFPTDRDSEVVAGVDVALRNDSMALVTAARVGSRVVVRARVWEAPPGGKLPHGEMREALRELSVKYPKLRVAYDPRFFEMLAQDLDDEGIEMIETPQVIERMGPACVAALEAIMGEELVHDGDPVFAEHVNNAVRRESERGWMLSKRKSGAHIDACVAMVLALAELNAPPEAEPEKHVFFAY